MRKVRKLLDIDNIHEKGILGENIGVAILDTGIYKHMDFMQPTSRIVCFKDCVNNYIHPYDDNGHGTHVAGICASNGFASGGVYKGIAPKCNIIAIKVLDKYGMGSVENVERALYWVIRNRKLYNIKIVNLSIGTYGRNEIDSDRLLNIVELCWDEGLIVLTAAGNKGPEPCSVTVPGTSRKIITVGNSEDCVYYNRKGKNTRNFSGCGPTKECVMKPEVVAPGCGIVSCMNTGNTYINKSGTSMSTPVVSGAIALAISVNENVQYINKLNKLVKKGLLETCNNIEKDKNSQGWGLINVKALVNYLNRMSDKI